MIKLSLVDRNEGKHLLLREDRQPESGGVMRFLVHHTLEIVQSQRTQEVCYGRLIFLSEDLKIDFLKFENRKISD